LTVETVAEAPRVEPGQLLVDVEASGINYLDVYQRSGRYKLPLPYTPGLEGVGRVREVSINGTSGGVGVGQRVAWINVLGSYASQVIVPAAQAIPVPDHLATAQALMFQSLTAQYLVTEYRDVRPGDRVLVHSAAGGVGLLLIDRGPAFIAVSFVLDDGGFRKTLGNAFAVGFVYREVVDNGRG
jgi:NADPH2:quinone reductase